MKKIIFLFAGLSFSLCTLAQNTNITTRSPQNHNLEGGSKPNNGGFGIKGGVNFNQLRGDDKDRIRDLKNPTTWHAGFYVQFPLGASDRFSLQPELLFNRRVVEAKDANQDDVEIKTDYLEIPLLFVYNVVDHVSLHIGPQAGVLLTIKENERELNESTKKLMHSFVWGAAGGVEGRISFARLGARYYFGMNDIYQDPGTIGGVEVEDLKNGMFQVYVGFGF